MQALHLTEHGLAYAADFPTPEPQAGEVVVRVLKAGICETDLQLVQGYMGFRGILGHEFVGVAQSGKYAGSRVVGEINCACQRCETCRGGMPTHCPHRTVLGILGHHGAFAETICVPEVNLLPVPDTLSTDHAVFTEPVAAAFEIPAQISLSAIRSAVVLGDGRLGALCAQVLRLHGLPVTVVGKHQEKLALLHSLGLQVQLRDDVQPQRTADLVVDCTGNVSGFTDALAWLRPRGTLVLKTTVAHGQPLNLAPLVIDEITVVGSRCGPFRPALDALTRGEISVAPFITSRGPLSDGLSAFENVRQSNAWKHLFDIG